MWKSTIVAVLCGASWLMTRPAANGQTVRPFDAGGVRGGSYAPPYSRPPVSPYVNLGYNANGLSNYQTLVRPMIDEREAISRQSVTLHRLDERMRRAAPSGEPGGDEAATPGRARRPRGVRFMHYSHYFGTLQ